MRQTLVTAQAIETTLSQLKATGARNSECVVLWLGRADKTSITIHRVYRPQQLAGSDIFRIPPASMKELMAVLKREELMIAAQVHSHPFEAFHSRADDDWAIVRHVNALSLVVPYFAKETEVSTFWRDTKTFKLSQQNHWLEVPGPEVSTWLKQV